MFREPDVECPVGTSQVQRHSDLSNRTDGSFGDYVIASSVFLNEWPSSNKESRYACVTW